MSYDVIFVFVAPDCGVIEDIISGLVDVLANVPVR